MDGAIDQLAESGTASVGADLARVDVALAHPSHLMAVLRGLFSWRHEIQEWSALRDAAHAEFSARGMDADALMKGLLGENPAEA